MSFSDFLHQTVYVLDGVHNTLNKINGKPVTQRKQANNSFSGMSTRPMIKNTKENFKQKAARKKAEERAEQERLEQQEEDNRELGSFLAAWLLTR